MLSHVFPVLRAMFLPVGLVAALLVSLISPARADIVPLANLSSYLNDLRSATATFSQINADGSVSTGTLYINRPGRARFEYDGDELLVIAGGRQVAIFDGRSNTRPEQYPLSETPLDLILARNVNLSRSGMVIDHRFDGTATRVALQDPDRPEIGFIELVFTPDPIELRQWIITDGGGAETTVVLGDLDRTTRIEGVLFNIPLEIAARSPD
ncbi:MAG: outer membrane lipoprotein carrier protein LolA [Pseudomonadota bacterium]